MSLFNWIRNALRICYPTKKRQKGNVKAWETLPVHGVAFIPGCNYYTIFESERSCLWVRPLFVPFIARQKKRLEKEGAPLAVRGFPRHPPPQRPAHPTSTPNRSRVPDSPRRGTHPKVKPVIPTASPQKRGGGVGGAVREDGPRLEQGSEKESATFPPRQGERRAVFKLLHRAPDWRGWGRGARGGHGDSHTPRAGTAKGAGGLRGSRYEEMQEMREKEIKFKRKGGIQVQFGPATVCLVSPRGR